MKSVFFNLSVKFNYICLFTKNTSTAKPNQTRETRVLNRNDIFYHFLYKPIMPLWQNLLLKLPKTDFGNFQQDMAL